MTNKGIVNRTTNHSVDETVGKLKSILLRSYYRDRQAFLISLFKGLEECRLADNEQIPF